MRYYQLNLSRHCPQSCCYCEGVGYRQEEKGLKEIEVSLLKAISGEYQAVLLPCNFLFHPQYIEILELIESYKISIVIQINSSYLHHRWKEIFELLARFDPIYHCVLDYPNSATPEIVVWLESLDLNIYYSVVIHGSTKLPKLIRQLPKEVVEELHLIFPYRINRQKQFLPSKKINKLLLGLQEEFSGFEPRPTKGVDLFDPRVAEGMDMEPVIDPILSSTSQDSKIKISVVIPTYNNKVYLVNTLEHLLRQNLSFQEFEVIVVDDGSDDNTREYVDSSLKSALGNFNFKFIYFPRTQSRKMGDGQFRAGIARNLGVKHAEGDLLVFLDSDILTPPDYLMRLWEEHLYYDVVMTERIYLKEEFSNGETRYDRMEPTQHGYIPEDGYWEKFYRLTDDTTWESLDTYWKYVCTYGLSLKKSVFKEVGWFRKNYIFYGFEDTDLGFRLYSEKLKFHRSSLKCLHLFHERKRSEFFNSDFKRQELLKKTARIFYHNTLNPEIYEKFRSLMS